MAFQFFALASLVMLGTASAEQPRPTKHFNNLAAVDEVLAIHPFAFEGLESIDMDALMVSGVQRYCDGLALCGLEAPVELPSGSIVTRIELDVVDDSTVNDVKANFYRCPVGTQGCDEPLAEITTSGAAGATQIGIDLGTPETVNNDDYTYLFEVAPGDDSQTRLVGARVFFRAPESRPTTDTLALNPFAHEARSATGRSSLAAVSIQRYCSGETCTLSAPVELPSGSRLTRIELDSVDTGSADVGLSLSRCQIATGACAPLASLATSGTPGTSQIGVDLNSPETVNNTTATYITEVTLGQTNSTRLIGARIEFESPSVFPRFDRLAVNPFAFEGRSANDIDAVEAFGGDRYCQGLACVLIAPVELASGTTVSRLEFSSWDNDAVDVRVSFSRCPVGATSCSEVAAVSTSGTPGSAQPGIDLVTPEVIDNTSATYQVAVELGSDSDTRIRAVSLVIENRMVFADGFGSGDSSAWSNTVP